MTLDTKLLRVSKCSSWLLIAAGLTVILGWQFRIPSLKGQMFGTFVAPNTALSFVVAGAAVLLRLSQRKILQTIGILCACFVTLFAIATGAEYLFSMDLHIDKIFMAHRLSDWFLPQVGRYATNSTVGFICAGMSLLMMRRQSGLTSEIFAICVLLVSYLSIIAQIFGASALYDHVMAVHTAVLFGLLATALLTGIAHPVLMGTLISPFAGAIASRKMILWVMLLVPVFGGAELWAERSGLVSLRLGTSLSTIASVTVFTFLALRIAMVLNETDRMRMENETALLKSMQLAAAGRMAASIAHEVNNPLESVTNLIFLMKSDEVPPETRKEYLEIAERELTRVAAIARRTLGFYRDDSKESAVDLNLVAEGILDLYREKLNSGIRLERRFTDSALISAKVGEIRQVVTNLIANAIDALRSRGGTLQVVTSCEKGHVTLSVSDDGLGIPAENLKKIYEPFFTTKKDTGTGLGLWVTKELVLRNGGVIQLQSSTDHNSHGTRFDISFPAIAKVPQSQASSAELKA